jgi:hypothetical protein
MNLFGIATKAYTCKYIIGEVERQKSILGFVGYDEGIGFHSMLCGGNNFLNGSAGHANFNTCNIKKISSKFRAHNAGHRGTGRLVYCIKNKTITLDDLQI